MDNCKNVKNLEQTDLDRDGRGEPCDDNPNCYVVDDTENCLDPDDEFKIYTPDAVGGPDSPTLLRLFSNRESVPIRYTWRIEKAPSGASASITNPVGAVSESSPYEYRYLADKAVKLVADKPGSYTVQVTAELVWEDELYPAAQRSQATAVIEVGGDSTKSGGCSITSLGAKNNPSTALVPLLLLALGLILRRRS